MKRVYLLLRNNHQSGPFTIAELLGQNLIASDMLWIEGQSAVWCYLSEIELTPAVKKEEAAIEKFPATIISASDDIEKRAEEIRKKVMAFHLQHFEAPKRNPAEKERHLTPVDTEEQIDIVDHRKVKSNMLSDVSMTAFIVLLVAGGIYGGRFLISNKTVVSETPTTIQSISADQHAAKSDNKKIATEENNSKSLLADSILKNAVTTNKKLVNKNKKNTTPATKLTAEKTPVIEDATSNEKTIDLTGEIIVKNEIIASPAKDELVKEEPQKKKGFLKKLFGKKKKEDKSEEGN